MAIKKQIKEITEYYNSICSNNSIQNVNTLNPKFKKAIHELEVIDNAITQQQYSSVKAYSENVLNELRNNINRLENKLIKLGEENGRLKQRLELLTSEKTCDEVAKVEKDEKDESKLINGIKDIVPDVIEKKVKAGKGYKIDFDGKFIRRKYNKADVVADYKEHHTITKGMCGKYGVSYHTLRELLINEGVWEFPRKNRTKIGENE